MPIREPSKERIRIEPFSLDGHSGLSPGPKLDKPGISCNSDSAILSYWLSATVGFSQLLSRLTPAQCLVLRSFLHEPSDRVVARELSLSESTVRNHLTAIEGKFNLASREHLMAMCMAALMRERVGSAEDPGPASGRP